MMLNMGLAVVFLAFSFTDFLDGYLARKYHLTTKLGGALDHIADKFLTYSAFIALLTVGKIYFFWVIIFIGRDFFVMGLRQIALENNFNLPVDYLGKIKTALQMLLITLLIIRPTYMHNITMQLIEKSMIFCAIIITMASCYHYYITCIKYYNDHS